MANVKKTKTGALALAVCGFALAVVVGFWVAAIMLAQHDLERTLAEIDDSTRNLTLSLSEHAARTLDYADRVALQVKAAHEAGGGFRTAGAAQRELTLNTSIVVGIFVADARGNVRQIDRPQGKAANLRDREHFKQHAATDTGRPVISRPLSMRTSDRPGIFLSRRLNRGDGSFDGIVSVAIDPAVFTRVFHQIGLGEKGLIVLVGLDGFVRARSSGEVDLGGQDVRGGPLFPEYARRDAGTARYISVVDAVARRVAFRRVDGYPLVMSVGVAEDAVLSEVQTRRRYLYSGAVAATLLAFAACLTLLIMLRRRERDAVTVRESEARFRLLMDDSPDATFVKRAEVIIYVNKAFLNLVGARVETEVLGQSIFRFLHADFHAAVRARSERAEAGETVVESPLQRRRFLRLDGSPIEVETASVIVRLPDGPARHVVVHDVSARIAAETALRESMDRYRDMIEAFPDAVFINRGDAIVYANPAALQLLGTQGVDAVIGKSPLDFVHDADRADARLRMTAMMAGNDVPGVYEQRFVRFDGRVVETEINASIVFDQGVRVRQVVVRDITQRKQIEAALQDSEARYRMLVEESPDAVLIYEADCVVYANAAAVHMLGASGPQQLIGRSLFEMIHPDGHAAALARRAYVIQSGLPTGLFEQTYIRVDGTSVEVEGSSRLVPGIARQRQLVLRDIGARKRAEAALRESEQRLRMAVDAAAMTVWEWDIASRYTHWGYGHEKLLGPLPPDTVRYPDFRNLVHADDSARFIAAGRTCIEQGAAYDIEFRLIRTDGAERWMRSTGRAVYDAAGRVEGMVGIMQDVTARHAVEQELADSRQRSEVLMESIPAPAWLKDRDGRFLAVNRAWSQRFNSNPGFAIGCTNSDLFPPEVAAERDREDAAILQSRQEYRVERMTRVDGKLGWFETVKLPVFDEHGEVSGIVGVSFDTTARNLAAAQLRESDERFRQFADAAFSGFWIVEPAPLRPLYINKAFSQIFGLDMEALRENPWLFVERIHPEERALEVASFKQWAADDTEDVYFGEYRIVRADGQIRWIRDRGSKLRDAGGKIYRLQGIVEDITDQRNAEIALAESRQRRDALLEANLDPAWLKDLQGRYIAVNRAWLRNRGSPEQTVVGLTDRELFGAERAELIVSEDRRVIEDKVVVRSERNWHEIDGRAWIETVKAPVLDAAGNVIAVFGLSHDITERKRSEQAVLEMNATLAAQTDELTALNRELESFAYTVSHDLRAPLRHIDGFVNLLKTHAGPLLDAQNNRYFDRVSQAARRMAMLIDDLLAFSRTGRTELRLRRVSLQRLVDEAVENLKPDTATRQIEWTIGALPDVEGDAGLLAIVIQNLLSNAVKYSRPRALAQIAIEVAAGADGMLELSVRDNGVGFEMQYADKLFGVFQRMHTDAEFEGTGIGLATVARIVQRHGGRVWADSVLGEGSVFYLTLRSMPEDRPQA